uniref:Uncharacterized protein n=1 Tax=viral metagenome TaxID=1070528 RepID=A0A6C0BKH9_9ZZZZ
MYISAYLDSLDLFILASYDRFLCINRHHEWVIWPKKRCQTHKRDFPLIFQYLSTLKVRGLLKAKLDPTSQQILRIWRHSSREGRMIGGGSGGDGGKEDDVPQWDPKMPPVEKLEYKSVPVFAMVAKRLSDQKVIPKIADVNLVINAMILVFDIMLPIVTIGASVAAIVGTAGTGGDVAVESVTSTVNSGMFAVKLSRATVTMARSSIYLMELLQITFDRVPESQETDPDPGPEKIKRETRAVIKQMIRDGNEDLISDVCNILSKLSDGVMSVVGDWISTLIPDDASITGKFIRFSVDLTVLVGAQYAFQEFSFIFNHLPHKARRLLKYGDELRVFLNEMLTLMREMVRRIAAGEMPRQDLSAAGVLGRVHDKILTQIVPGLKLSENVAIQMGMDKVLLVVLDEYFAPNIDNAIDAVIRSVPLAFVILVFSEVCQNASILEGIKEEIKKETSAEQPAHRASPQLPPPQFMPPFATPAQTTQNAQQGGSTRLSQYVKYCQYQLD